MTDPVPSEKIYDYINILFKKQNIFQKIDKIKSYTWYFILFSSVIGVTSIYINYYNFKDIKKIYFLLRENEKSLNQIKDKINNIYDTDIYENVKNLNSSNSSISSDEMSFISINSDIFKKEIENLEEDKCILR